MVDYKEVILDLNRTCEERIQAAFNLENIADEPSIKAMAKCLFTDPSAVVRHEAAFALGETAAPGLAGPYLMQAVEKDDHEVVQHEALLALGTLGDSKFIPFCEKFLNDPNPFIKESAEIAILRLKASH